MTKENLPLFSELYMLHHNTLQLQHPIFFLYLALFPVFSILACLRIAWRCRKVIKRFSGTIFLGAKLTKKYADCLSSHVVLLVIY